MELERAAAKEAPRFTGKSGAASSMGDVSAQRAERTRGIRRILFLVLGLNLGVAALKLGFGVWSGSVAMNADGVQSLFVGFSNVVGLIGIAIAARPPDQEHHYGHERYETLASLVIAALMTIGVLEILRSAWHQLRTGESPTVSWISFAVLSVTIAVNLGVTVWERRAGRRLRSELLLADAKHTASDVLASGAVMVGLAAVGLGWNGADAVVSLVIAAAIAWAAWTILRDASLVLTDATFVDPRGLLGATLATPGVVTAHNLRARTSGGRLLVELHVTVDPLMRVGQAHEVASEVEVRLRDQAGEATEVIVHVEPAEPPHTRPDPLFGD